MVQVQSTLFPLYDRNPQTYVDNIFNAKPADYKPATESIYHGGNQRQHRTAADRAVTGVRNSVVIRRRNRAC